MVSVLLFLLLRCVFFFFCLVSSSSTMHRALHACSVFSVPPIRKRNSIRLPKPTDSPQKRAAPFGESDGMCHVLRLRCRWWRWTKSTSGGMGQGDWVLAREGWPCGVHRRLQTFTVVRWLYTKLAYGLLAG